MNYGTLSFDPYVPLSFLLALAAVLLAFHGFGAWRGLAGWPLRLLSAAVVLAALANPSWKTEDREPLANVVFVVVDETSSQSIEPRPGQVAEALASVTGQLNALGKVTDGADILDTRIVRVPDSIGPDADLGSRVMSALAQAAADVSPERIAAALILSDGRIDDAAVLDQFPAPVHLLLTGEADEWDRRLVIETAPAYGIVGEATELRARVEALGKVPGGQPAQVPVFLSVDGGELGAFSVPVGESFSLPLEIGHGGPNVLQLTIPDAESELTWQNNQAVLTINGVRDRLRVLLVSGEPYAGERTWRNLLKADPSVDLVHFTILRPPEKQDGVPVFELSLIAFPTRELFMDKIDEFDLIIFDRYRNREILPNSYLENVVNYVRAGGAILVTAGPAFAGAESLFRSPLGDILPAAPTGQIIEQGFTPFISQLGRKHPVTESLEDFAPLPASADGRPGWGRWFRLVESEPLRGQTVMNGPDGTALLVLDRVGEGRVAQLASDQAWLWSRGFEGGGPQLELLRRLAHWLMKEPELEEEVLSAEVTGADVTVTRRSLEEASADLEITAPDGSVETLAVQEISPGKWQAQFAAPENGLYRIRQGDVTALAAVGPAVPREFVNAISTPDILAPLVDTTRGGIVRLSDGVPDIRLVREDRVSAGNGWIGIAERDAYRVTDVTQTPLAPAWLMLALAALLLIAAWRIEGR